MVSGLYRLPLALTSWYVGHKASRPPRPPATPEERSAYESSKDTRDLMSYIIWWYVPAMLVLIYTIIVGEVFFDTMTWATSLRNLFPFTESLCPSSALQEIRVTSPFLVGCFLTTAGAILRLLCYRELGRQFTFELSSRKDDKLITTGPYSYVRHPSYTGAFVYLIGFPLWLVTSGSWFAECGMWQTTAGKVYVITLIAMLAFFLSSIARRVVKEDKVLRDTYGAQWEAWAKKTPYKVLPGIY
ncbi:hypothetical protein K474DRAFT_1705284 [Panus rudis PR-1116 ss-1]|nr:hypothetical protein K474DRAFT_1705284 [Panus rudis PR-1116 ss-1]